MTFDGVSISSKVLHPKSASSGAGQASSKTLSHQGVGDWDLGPKLKGKELETKLCLEPGGGRCQETSQLSNCGHAFTCITMKTRQSPEQFQTQVISLPLCLTQFWTCFDISPFFFYFFLSVSEEKLRAGLIRGKVRHWLVTKPLAKAETLSGTSSLEVSASRNEWQTEALPLTSNSASPSPWCGRTQEARQKRVKTLWQLSKQQGSKLLHVKCMDSLWEE